MSPACPKRCGCHKTEAKPAQTPPSQTCCACPALERVQSAARKPQRGQSTVTKPRPSVSHPLACCALRTKRPAAQAENNQSKVPGPCHVCVTQCKFNERHRSVASLSIYLTILLFRRCVHLPVHVFGCLSYTISVYIHLANSLPT